ncbi:Lipoyl synthase [Hibiscus syriacus]|uniref:Lipoyl synthase n=1 Tax=Hibiscus syriacus TaxID=106335 RepID=A0A6A3CBV8_HIBSY|nr:Lipoyl synthase [Hibiscus syriacus]
MDSNLIHDMDSDMILDLNYVLIFDISVYGRNMFYWGGLTVRDGVVWFWGTYTFLFVTDGVGRSGGPNVTSRIGSGYPHRSGGLHLVLQSLVLYRNHLVVSYQVSIKISSWGLDYVVITSVDRDGLADQGSGHFAEKVEKLKTLKPKMLIEALVPDFRGDAGCVEKVTKSGLDVFAHNIETVEELQRDVRDDRANFKQSLDVLMMAKEYAPAGTLTKTSIMLGCGETPNQVVKTMEKVRAAGVDVMTFGLY